jgi:hypothetical protein
VAAARRSQALLSLRENTGGGPESASRLLQAAILEENGITEAAVVGENGLVLASSDPARAGRLPVALADFTAWSRKPAPARILDLAAKERGFAFSFPLDGPGRPGPGSAILISISSAPLRRSLRGPVYGLGVASLLAAGLSLAAAALFANLLLRPLARINDTIDRIAAGSPVAPLAAEGQAREFADVQSKLTLLGQQFRSAREDEAQLRGNIERLLGRLEEVVLVFDRHDRLVMAGQPAERFLGKPRSQLLRKPLEEVFPDTDPLGALILSAAKRNEPVKDRLLERGSGANRQRLLVDIEVLFSSPGRERSGTLVALRESGAGRQIPPSLDLPARLSAISRLTAGVAHEIKNPLNAIALHLEVLRSKLATRGEPAPEIDVIASEIRRLDRVVKTFLDFTRPIAPAMRAVNLSGVAEEVVRLVEPQAQRRNVRIETSLPAFPVTVWGDPDLLKQALLNVVVNGVEAMEGHGRLQVELRRAGRECVLSVTDEGAGIPPELQGKIFNLYFSTKESGSGIGLAVAFQAVQVHNGTIEFRSEPGAGSTFWLRFPLADDAAAGPGPAC